MFLLNCRLGEKIENLWFPLYHAEQRNHKVQCQKFGWNWISLALQFIFQPWYGNRQKDDINVLDTVLDWVV